MPKTRINCPNCRQPIMADVEQIFDVAQDLSAKSQLLSGLFNLVQCPFCGYQGNLATPIVYHDPQKELLLTYFPPELGLPRDEQERVLGGLINQVVNRLSAEQRKGYLLRPQSNLTMQSLIERVLEAEGITREMIQAQQQRLSLLQRLMAASDQEVRLEILRQEKDLVDAELFNLLGRLRETAAVTGDRESATRLEDLQRTLLDNSEFGQRIKQQSQEVEAALQSLQQAGSELTREKLLDLIISAPNETRLSALVSLTRPGIDYAFFQLLSERIDQAQGEERDRLTNLRETLLQLTRQIDAQIEARVNQARQLLGDVLKSDEIEQAIEENLSLMDDYFLQVLNSELEAARGSGDLEKIGKLQQVMAVIQQAGAAPPEIDLIQRLIEESSEGDRRRLIEENQEQINPDFFQILSGLIAQLQETNQDPELLERLKSVNRMALRFSMETNLRGS
jgi:hypothetical protein